jgi:hypothetical protein
MAEHTTPDGLLRIYINDHRAGATGGLALAKRMRGEHATDRFGPAISELLAEIEQDAASLERLAADRHIGRNPLKHIGALVGERAGRLKLNGRLRQRSPLSLVLELEALMAGVDAKRNLWRALQLADVPRSTLDLDGLIARASGQHDRLRALHAEAAGAAFGAARSTAQTARR